MKKYKFKPFEGEEATFAETPDQTIERLTRENEELKKANTAGMEANEALKKELEVPGPKQGFKLPEGTDKEGLIQRIMSASRLSQEDRNLLVDLVNKSA